MAAIPVANLATIRNKIEGSVHSGTITKPKINAIIQAVEDWFETNRASLGAAINVVAQAQIGQNLTAGQMKALVKFWLQSKFDRE